MYLQAFYLSDIVDMAGNYINPWAIKVRGEGTRRSMVSTKDDEITVYHTGPSLGGCAPGWR
jgi:hypothetical protein